MGKLHIKKQTYNFCMLSSMKGLARAARAPNLLLRVIWSLAVLIGGAIALWHLINMLKTYFEFHVITSISKIKRFTNFPDITICNMQAIKSGVSPEFLQELEHNYSEIVMEKSSEMSESIPWLDPMRYLHLQGFFENTDKARIKDLGHKMSEMIVICQLQGWFSRKSMKVSDVFSCIPDEDVITFLHPQYFVCHTIHVAELTTDKSTKRYKPSPNEIRALSLILYIDDFLEHSFEHLGVSSGEEARKGMIMSIHERGTYPNLEKGVYLAPGRSISVELDRMERHLQKPPHGDCTDQSKVVLSSGEELKYTNRLETCRDFCLQEKLIEICGCISSSLPSTEKMRDENPYCGNLSHQSDDHTSELNRCDMEVYSARLQCDDRCTEPCVFQEFTQTIHQATWPHHSYQLQFYYKVIDLMESHVREKFAVYPLIKETMQKNRSKAFHMLQKSDLISKNFMEVNVRFDSPYLTLMEDEAAMTTEVLLSSIGGLLNLWIGVSFVTLFEVLEYFYLLLAASQNKSPKLSRRATTVKR